MVPGEQRIGKPRLAQGDMLNSGGRLRSLESMRLHPKQVSYDRTDPKSLAKSKQAASTHAVRSSIAVLPTRLRLTSSPVAGCECDRRRDLNFCWGWLFSRRISNSE